MNAGAEDRLESHVRWAMMQALSVVRAQKAYAESKDAVAEGLRAMCLAWGRYEPSQGPFEPFARKRVTGAVRRFLKQHRDRQALEVLHDHTEEIDAALNSDGDPWSRLTAGARVGAEAIADSYVLADAATGERPDEDLAEEMKRCNAQEQAIFDLRYREDLSWEEIGDRIGLGAEQARYLDKKLRKKVGAALARRRK